MNDFIGYMSLDPYFRSYHHGELTFSMIYAYSEDFILTLSHDEVVHGKGSMIGKMPGKREQQFANLRAAYGFWMTHPGNSCCSWDRISPSIPSGRKRKSLSGICSSMMSTRRCMTMSGR